jgi:microcystin degradation protein MlrC
MEGRPVRVVIAEFKQETATFNPAPTRYGDFRVYRGASILSAYSLTGTELSGALSVFNENEVEAVPTFAASAVSGGRVAGEDLDRLLNELVESVSHHTDADGIYVALHGAMAGEDEDDPEGRLLLELRQIAGKKPIVASIDLHAVLTDRMLSAADVLVPYHTYPHVDHYETGRRAARILLKLLRSKIRPTTARVALPMLVRGDELITATGCFGEAIRACQKIEQSPGGLIAGVVIGNAFTDVPALQSNVLVTTNDDLSRAVKEANEIGQFMWDHREMFQAALTPLDEAIRMAENATGLTVFSDAADATASGASGDSNAILNGLLEFGYSGTSLLAIVDALAVENTFQTGVGGTLSVSLGGTRDPGRFQPIAVNAYVKSLHDGRFTYEDGTQARAGRAAVIVVQRIHILVTERPVYVVGRRVFQQHGLDPQDFDMVVVKSPNGFRTWYESIASLIIPVDVPGSTSANLRSLPFENCIRPIFPLDRDVPSPFE